MDSLEFRYSPRSGTVSYLEVSRDAAYLGKTAHMHDHEELLLITSSSRCECVSNGSRLSFQAPAIVLHRTGTFHEVVRVGAEGTYTSRVAFFHESLLEGLPEGLTHRQSLFQADTTLLPLSKAQLGTFLGLFDLLKARQDQPERMLPPLLCILSEMDALVSGGQEVLRSRSRETYIFDVIAAIRSGGQRLTTGALAERFYVSQTKLKQDFRKITGMSVKAYSMQVRLRRAAALLESTDTELGDIAAQCGFSGESYFIEAFRKHYGMTPGVFRKSRKQAECNGK